MRPTSFHSEVLRQHLLRAKMATLDELKRSLGTPVGLTVFRKLKQLDYLTSYSIALVTTRCVKSPVSTPRDCGRMRPCGSLVTARC